MMRRKTTNFKKVNFKKSVLYAVYCIQDAFHS